MPIEYQLEPRLSVDEFIDVLVRSTLGERRPVQDRTRMQQMIDQATILFTARAQGRLVGISRALSDHSFCTYVSDLAVDTEFQRQGIGKELLHRTHEEAGLQTTLLLVAAPKAATYYPKIGMVQHPSCWTIPGLQ